MTRTAAWGPTESSIPLSHPARLDLIDGAYVTTAGVRGTETVALQLPFAIEVTPADLVRPAP